MENCKIQRLLDIGIIVIIRSVDELKQLQDLLMYDIGPFNALYDSNMERYVRDTTDGNPLAIYIKPKSSFFRGGYVTSLERMKILPFYSERILGTVADLIEAASMIDVDEWQKLWDDEGV